MYVDVLEQLPRHAPPKPQQTDEKQDASQQESLTRSWERPRFDEHWTGEWATSGMKARTRWMMVPED